MSYGCWSEEGGYWFAKGHAILSYSGGSPEHSKKSRVLPCFSKNIKKKEEKSYFLVGVTAFVSFMFKMNPGFTYLLGSNGLCCKYNVCLVQVVFLLGTIHGVFLVVILQIHERNIRWDYETWKFCEKHTK